MTLAPGRSPHASRALAMPACLSRPDDALMSRALAMSACLSRPGDARMPLSPWRLIKFTEEMRGTRQLPQGFEGVEDPTLQQLIETLRTLREANEQYRQEQERL
ncbi:hypothetical protein VNO80_30623 [Phaseolus coccineus]|uniref:Uncharacterized protein n=1 Tax=Phaseolus coccineus TaxID=3886 RepID=A0AAN9QFZ6_PHACN